MNIEEQNVRLKRANKKLKQSNAELEIALVQEKINHLKLGKKFVHETIQTLETSLKTMKSDMEQKFSKKQPKK
jgi:hypothetical protein